MKVYKRYGKYLRTMNNIDLPYLKRTLGALKSFVDAWYNGTTIREEYFESEPIYIIRTLYLPVYEISGTNHIPKYLSPLLFDIATLLQCKLVYKQVLVMDDTDEPMNTVKIVGPEENVQLCHHILQRTIIDLIRAKTVLVKHYKAKNKILFGKQRNATTKATEMIIELATKMEQIIAESKAEQREFLYHRYALKLGEKKANGYFKLEGKQSSRRGFAKNKLVIR